MICPVKNEVIILVVPVRVQFRIADPDVRGYARAFEKPVSIMLIMSHAPSGRDLRLLESDTHKNCHGETCCVVPVLTSKMRAVSPDKGGLIGDPLGGHLGMWITLHSIFIVVRYPTGRYRVLQTSRAKQGLHFQKSPTRTR